MLTKPLGFTNQTEQIVYHAMRNWGCPVHYENIAMMLGNNQGVGYTATYRYIRHLTMLGHLRRVRPGVYSAFGEERD